MQFILLSVISIFTLTVVLGRNIDSRITEKRKTTADRIIEHGYPAEEHQIKTEDGYILTVFRIPYSPKLQNAGQTKPVVFLMHGLLSCSDCYILNGPDNAIAFLFSDAGYDVWLGNARGNTYSRHHIKLSTKHPYFWGFSWHEIGVYDLPAMIDFVLEESKQTQLHYVGHSQGTTVYLVLMSMKPEYNDKIKTGHLLAPVAYAGNMVSELMEVGAPYFGQPGIGSTLFESAEFIPRNEFIQDLAFKVCGSNPILPELCSNVFFLWAGPDSVNLNMTLLPFVAETHPAGISTDQLLHYEQEFVSKRFCTMDRGAKRNLILYNRETVIDYPVEKIVSNVYLYVGLNDDSANPTDVDILAGELPNLKGHFLLDDPTWGHLDFIFANQVKEEINDKVIQICNDYENEH